MDRATETRPTANLIRIQGLSRRFREGDRERRVLDQLELEVARGECLALLGASGSGKSTLLNLLAGIDRPDQGRITIQGQDMGCLSERERTLFRRRNIGFVYQFFNLLPTLSVAENIWLPLALNRRDTAAERRRVLDLLAETGLGGREQSFPDLLSGGEQQRVALVRALAHEPLLVLADEPTGNLDSATGQQVLDLLDRLVRRAGHTLIMVTHSREVAAFADRIVTLRDGRLVAG